MKNNKLEKHEDTGNREQYAIITGASRGIGKAIANELWINGYSLILISRSITDLSKVKNDLKFNTRQHAHIFAVDITKDKDVDDLFKKIDELNIEIRVLINNAAILAVGGAELSTTDFRNLIDTNLIGAHNMARHILPNMKKHGAGYIINMGSVTGENAPAAFAGYSASKSALRGLNDSLFKELSIYGIKVTCISPSIVETESTKVVPGFKQGEKIQPQDIAKTVVFLLSLGKSAMIKEIDMDCIKLVRMSSFTGFMMALRYGEDLSPKRMLSFLKTFLKCFSLR